MRRRIGFRWVVAALVLTIVAPLTILGGIGIERAWGRQLANFNRQNLATARAISVAVDQEVQGTTAALYVLGELHALDAPDLPAFESLAGRLLPYQHTWSAIMLSDADGRLLDGVPDKGDGNARVGAERLGAGDGESSIDNRIESLRSAGHDGSFRDRVRAGDAA